MSSRTTKRSIPPTPSRRTTRRGIAALVDADAELTQFGPVPIRPDGGGGDDDDIPEPAASARPTRRDIAVPEIAMPRTRSRSRSRSLRGEFSIASARGIATDEVAGSIEVPPAPPARRRRPTTQKQPPEAVRLVAATKRQLTVEIGGKPLTLERHDALALAQIILTAFA